MSEKDAFLENLPEVEKQDAFGEVIPSEAKVEETEVEEKSEPQKRENRETRRLREKLQAERESSIALAARLEVLSEVQKFRNESGTDKPDETLARIYGTTTPEGVEATRLLTSALDAREQRAVDKALEVFRSEQEKAQKEVQKEVDTLNTIEERIEDEYGVDFSTEKGKQVKSQYFSYLERMSPKDEAGNVKDYADPFATWEEFDSKRKQQSSAQTERAKDLGSRGMVRSGASSESKLEQTAQERYLREIGII